MGPSAPGRRGRETVPSPPPPLFTPPVFPALALRRNRQTLSQPHAQLCGGWQGGGLPKPPGRRSWGGGQAGSLGGLPPEHPCPGCATAGD